MREDDLDYYGVQIWKLKNSKLDFQGIRVLPLAFEGYMFFL